MGKARLCVAQVKPLPPRSVSVSSTWLMLKRVSPKVKTLLSRLTHQLAGGIGPDAAGRGLAVRDPYFGVVMMREFFTAVNNFRDYCRKNDI